MWAKPHIFFSPLLFLPQHTHTHWQGGPATVTSHTCSEPLCSPLHFASLHFTPKAPHVNKGWRRWGWLRQNNNAHGNPRPPGGRFLFVTWALSIHYLIGYKATDYIKRQNQMPLLAIHSPYCTWWYIPIGEVAYMRWGKPLGGRSRQFTCSRCDCAFWQPVWCLSKHNGQREREREKQCWKWKGLQSPDSAFKLL